MSHTNNIYIPYIEGFHDKNIFFYYKNYYEKIGFTVKSFNEKNVNHLNYSKIINDLIKFNKEEILIIIDYIIIPKFAIIKGIEIAKQEKCLVKPMHRTFFIDQTSDSKKIIKSLINEDILNNFNYSNNIYYKMWPLNGAWIFYTKNIKKINENILEPFAFDFEFCYKNAIFNKLIFVNSDSYKIDLINVNIDPAIEFLYKSYLYSINNLFGTPNNVYFYNNDNLKKMENKEIEENIFNIEKYFSFIRYI